MKITRIVISDFHQFGYLNLDLTYPKDHPTKAGEPLNKACFIGKNGTGKTTILGLVRDTLNALVTTNVEYLRLIQREKSQFCIELDFEGKRFLVGWFVKYKNRTTITNGYLQLCLSEFYDDIPDFFEEVFVKKNPDIVERIFTHNNEMVNDINQDITIHSIGQDISKNSLLIFSPTEYSANNSFTQLYSLSNLNEGLEFGRRLSYYHKIAFDNLKDFWSLLIYQVQQRERERNDFENRDSNLKRTKEELIDQFEKQYPEILKIIADKWKVILDDVGLYFDAEDVKKPIVLTDPLIAYIKDTKTKKNISFGELSSGIKNLIFTMGYMISLYFHRDIKSSTAIFDEPEFSLFPDILLKLIDIYTDPKDFPNTQFFFATHSPLVASQFEPEERVCLHFDEERKVYYTRGITPIGDDPNDILTQDFGLVEIMPKSGVEKWHEYLNLKRRADKETNESKKEEILERLYTIRSKYKFPAA